MVIAPAASHTASTLATAITQAAIPSRGVMPSRVSVRKCAGATASTTTV
jgi:hypothetical protein